MHYPRMNGVKNSSSSGRNAIASTPPSRKALPPFEALRAFDAAVRLKGIRRAAQSIGRDHTVISRHLRSLETWAGVKLVERTAGGITTTEAGARYHQKIAGAFDEIAIATIELMRRSNHNHLNIWSAAAFALHWLSPRLATFEKRFPRVELELRSTDTSPDFRRYEGDVDIRLVANYGDNFQMQDAAECCALAEVPIIAVASPEYLDRNSTIEKPADLVGQRLLHEDTFDVWANWLVAHGVYEDIELHGLRLWQGHLTLDAAVNGRGIALTNPVVAGEMLRSGALVQIGENNPTFEAETLGVYLFIAGADRWSDPVLTRFRNWLKQRIKEEFPQYCDTLSVQTKSKLKHLAVE